MAKISLVEVNQANISLVFLDKQTYLHKGFENDLIQTSYFDYLWNNENVIVVVANDV